MMTYIDQDQSDGYKLLDAAIKFSLYLPASIMRDAVSINWSDSSNSSSAVV